MCALPDALDGRRAAYGNTIEDKPTDRQKVKRQNELLFVVFSFRRTADRCVEYSMNLCCRATQIFPRQAT